MNGNDFVKFFLRTPLRLLMGKTMLITVTGRKTGRKYTTPVGYYRGNGCLWVMSSRDRTWWRNVKGGANVMLLVNGNSIPAFAETIVDEKEVKKHIEDYVRHIPMSARALGIRVENGLPNAEDVARAAADRLFVKFKTDSK